MELLERGRAPLRSLFLTLMDVSVRLVRHEYESRFT